MKRSIVNRIACPTLLAGLLIGVVYAAVGCGTGDTAAPTGPDPRVAAHDLLALHGLVGRQPEERSEQEREQEIDPQALGRLIADLEEHDPFLADIYVGFVLGVLARHQTRLVVDRLGSRAVIIAGKARIVVVLDAGSWKIVLGESVPDEIKRRALEEQRRFDEAKAASGR